ncbi:MAG: hypothetical protein PHF60_02575 [Candidatus ainarchaeum sp.]|nr:hypothetical protein [Candidatus ainarchaeum sp.]
MMGGEEHILQSIATRRLSVGSYTPIQLQAAIAGEIEDLDADHIRRIISTCFVEGREEHGIAMAEGVITLPGIRNREEDEKVATAVTTLSFFAAKDWGISGKGSQPGRRSVFNLLDHPDPEVVKAVITNLSRGADFELFRRISGFMLSDAVSLRLAAQRYAEVQTSELAFSWEDEGMLAGNTIGFLRKEADVLKAIDVTARKKGNESLDKRLKLMISLIYNHMLKGLKKEAEKTWAEKAYGQYYGTYGFLVARFGPQSHPVLFRKLETPWRNGYINPTKELRVRKCIVETLERMGANAALKPAIIEFLNEYASRTETERPGDAEIEEKRKAAGKRGIEPLSESEIAEIRGTARAAARNLETGVMRFELKRPPEKVIQPRPSMAPKAKIPTA